MNPLGNWLILKNKKLFVIPPSLGPFGLRPYPAPSERWHGFCFAPPATAGRGSIGIHRDRCRPRIHRDPCAAGSLAIVTPGRRDPLRRPWIPRRWPLSTRTQRVNGFNSPSGCTGSLAIMTRSTENPAGEGITQRVTGAGESWPVRQL